MTPTPEQVKAEIEGGPLASALAGPWADVFPTEPEPPEDTPAHARWERISPRFGLLTPDAVFALRRVLNDPTSRTRPVPRQLSLTEMVATGAFSPAGAAAVFGHDRYPDFRDAINNQDGPGAVATATMFRVLGVIGRDDLAAFTAYVAGTVPAPCSRLTELDWTGVTDDLLNAAKGV